MQTFADATETQLFPRRFGPYLHGSYSSYSHIMDDADEIEHCFLRTLDDNNWTLRADPQTSDAETQWSRQAVASTGVSSAFAFAAKPEDPVTSVNLVMEDKGAHYYALHTGNGE